MVNDLLKYRSGRVIALCRAALAIVFLFAIWADNSQPAYAAAETYTGLMLYAATSVALVAITWNNWWLDSKLAAPAHILDVAAFTLLVFGTEGYTSPFFVFFVFLILAAVIRWSWRETAITAVAVILLFFTTGLLVADLNTPFDFQRFIVRSGNLVVLSAILIWFGVNQGFFGVKLALDGVIPDATPGESPLQTTVAAAMEATGACKALLLWRASGSNDAVAMSFGTGETVTQGIPVGSVVQDSGRAFLFDLPRNRGFRRGRQRKLLFFKSRSVLPADLIRQFGIDEGLALSIQTDLGEGKLLLSGIEGLSIDYVELGAQLRDALVVHIHRHALLSAMEEGAISRARLSLARDLHDGIVQFLAGATFRVEAISRSLRSGEQPERELSDLKDLLLVEQQELRSSIGALREDLVPLPVLAEDLERVCGRLARQWDIRCSFSAKVPDVPAPMRLHLDIHQLIREAVANAVRHAQAKSVEIALSVEDSDVRLDISNDGAGNERLKDGRPWSLRERVDEANGTLMLEARPTGSSLSITLPLKKVTSP